MRALRDAGFAAYIVGGAVRDILVNMMKTHSAGQATAGEIEAAPPYDYDFTTNARPEEILKLFPEAFYENQFGTVMITPQDLRAQFNLPEPAVEDILSATAKQKLINLEAASKIHDSLVVPKPDDFKLPINAQERNFEITTYRSDGAYADHRHPEAVSWGQTLEEDLERRDFTINAMALQIKPESLDQLISEAENEAENSEFINLNPEQYQIIDPHHGLRDLAAGMINTVGDPEQRFTEDALRILRALRLAVQLNLQIGNSTYEAIIKQQELLEHISWERIGAEFLKMIASDHPKAAIELLDDTGLLKIILPELLAAKGVEQGGHHTTDVWTHSLDALAECPSSDPVVKLATLLHDIAKPQTYNETDGSITFYNHEVVGARIAKKIAARLRLSKKDQNRIFTLVRYHMFYYQPKNSDASIRRFMRKVGLENIDDILQLREGDRLGSGARKTSWRLEEMKQRMLEQLNQPLEVRDLAIDGHDLMDNFDLQPGPQVGKVLNQLFELVLENPQLNQKETLMKEAKKIISDFDA